MKFSEAVLMAYVENLKTTVAPDYQRRYQEEGTALWDQIYLSALLNEPLPEWARRAIFKTDDGLDEGAIRDFNAALGKHKNAISRKHESLLDKDGQEALGRLQAHVKQGGKRDKATLSELANENGLPVNLVLKIAKNYRKDLDGLVGSDGPSGVLRDPLREIEMALRHKP